MTGFSRRIAGGAGALTLAAIPMVTHATPAGADTRAYSCSQGQLRCVLVEDLGKNPDGLTKVKVSGYNYPLDSDIVISLEVKDPNGQVVFDGADHECLDDSNGICQFTYLVSLPEHEPSVSFKATGTSAEGGLPSVSASLSIK